MSAFLGTQDGSDFYQVMRVLDSIQQSADQPVNLRLGGHVSFGFQSSLMHEVKVVPDGPGGYSYKIELNDYHLASSKSILPDTFVESVQVSMMDGNAAPKAFLDIFNSELIRSAYKIKKSLDPSLFNLTSSDASYFRSLDALSGLDGRPELRSSLVEFFGDSFEHWFDILSIRFDTFWRASAFFDKFRHVVTLSRSMVFYCMSVVSSRFCHGFRLFGPVGQDLQGPGSH